MATHGRDAARELPAARQFQEEASGFRKGLGQRQLQMIAIGSAIGTGLFLGAGGRLREAGPSLFVLYAVCGFFGYLILRALGGSWWCTGRRRAPSSPTAASSSGRRPRSSPGGSTG